jgi:Fic/DOC family
MITPQFNTHSHPTQFLIDLEDMGGKGKPCTLKSFMEREKNYDLAFCKAWKVFIINADTPLPDSNAFLHLLDTIQSAALSHLSEFKTEKELQTLQGRACKEEGFNYFCLSSQCSDRGGVQDLINKIFSGENLELHIRKINKDYFILNNKKFTKKNMLLNEAETIFFKTDNAKNYIMNTILSFYRDMGTKEIRYILVVNQTMGRQRQEKALEIIDLYFKKIREAESEEDKIKIVAFAMRDLLQLHLYWDGNGRSLYILANLLLHQNGLPLFYPTNMCLFDANSIKKIVEEIKEGQKRFKFFFGNKTMLTQGLELYSKTVQKLQTLVKAQFSSFPKISNSLSERNFNLLLRQSSSDKEFFLLLKFLLKHSKELGIDIASFGEKSGTALDVAKKFNNEEGIGLLQKYAISVHNVHCN